MRVVCISDTHGLHGRIEVPEGDLLLHAGDICNHGQSNEVKAFRKWMRDLPHPHKVLIAGNHDWALDCFSDHHRAAKPEKVARLVEQFAEDGIHYLQDSSVTIEGLNIYGSPWQPLFFHWAFNLPRKGPELYARWKAIPEDTDILLTHGPPHGILDLSASGHQTGCERLEERLRNLNVRLHVFGHIHEAYGTQTQGSRIYANACSCDLDYRPVNPPLVFEL